MRSVLLSTPPTWRKQVLRGFELAFVLLLGYYISTCSQPEPPDVASQTKVDTVVVTKVQIERREPDAKVGKLEQVVMPRVLPDYIAIAPHGADSTVSAFCNSAAFVKQDTSKLEPNQPAKGSNPILLVRSIRTESRLLPFTKAPVFAYGIASDGDLSERRYQLRQGWKLRADGDSLVVQNPRIPVKPIIGAGLLVGAGYLIHSLVK